MFLPALEGQHDQELIWLSGHQIAPQSPCKSESTWLEPLVEEHNSILNKLKFKIITTQNRV